METLTRDELIAGLKVLGFRMGGTASMKWRLALAQSNGTHTMVVLVRARGVDLLITPLAVTEMLNSDRKLSISMQRAGDRFVEYNYTESDTSVHQQTLSVASLFVGKQPIDDSYFQKVGIGRGEWASKHGNKAKPKAKVNATGEGDMSDVYEALGNGDGEPVYLSDGVWLGSGGSLEDRGR